VDKLGHVKYVKLNTNFFYPVLRLTLTNLTMFSVYYMRFKYLRCWCNHFKKEYLIQKRRQLGFSWRCVRYRDLSACPKLPSSSNVFSPIHKYPKESACTSGIGLCIFKLHMSLHMSNHPIILVPVVTRHQRATLLKIHEKNQLTGIRLGKK